MIDPKRIPYEVVEALGAALGNTRPTWDYRAAIAAALAAWPRMENARRVHLSDWAADRALILPLHTEARDA